MRIFIAIVTILSFASIAFAASTSVDPLTLGVGARSLAMGRTNLVAPGDVNAIFVNPANAAYIKDWGLTSMYTSLLEGEMNYTLLGGGKEFDFGGMGFAYLSGGTNGITVTTRDADGRIILAGTSFDYSNSVIALSWGKMFREKLAGGAILKSISKGFSGGYSTGSGLGLDVGIVYEAQPKTTIGFAIQNLYSGMSWDSGAGDAMPMLIKAGVTYPWKKDVLVMADADLSPFALHSGIEWMVNPTFALRGGIDQVPTGTETATNLTMGLGLLMRGFTFDLAYYMDSTLGANSTYYFTLGYVPPDKLKTKPKPKPKPKPPIIKPPPPEPEPVPKPKVESELTKKIRVYIKALETKLAGATKPARIAKLRGMIQEQKVRLENELNK
jgi:hypothetical protein